MRLGLISHDVPSQTALWGAQGIGMLVILFVAMGFVGLCLVISGLFVIMGCVFENTAVFLLHITVTQYVLANLLYYFKPYSSL